MKAKFAGIILILIIILSIGITVLYLKSKNKPKEQVWSNSVAVNNAEQKYKVTKVIDGDTIEVDGKTKVRYIGMDTPETKGQCFATEATKRNEELVLGKTVVMKKDVSDKDKYGRLLRYVYLDGIMVNKILVKEGFGKADMVPPDTKFNKVFTEVQKMAKDNNLGLWSKCK